MRNRFYSWCIGGTLSWMCACSASEPAATPTRAPIDSLSDCSNELDQQAHRPGALAQATLLYACNGNACTGHEGFASGMRHSISVEAQAAPEASIVLESSDESVFALADTVSAFDPCAEQHTAWATLEARGPGQAELRVRDANGELDTIPVRVAEPAVIVVRATSTQDFAFESPSTPILAAEGESWLLLPEIYDASRALLVGLPALTWEVDDQDVAEVRTEPQTESEHLVSDGSARGMAFLEAKRAGETGVRVKSPAGMEAGLRLRVFSR